MAGHIWDVKKLQPTTIQRWKFLFQFALGESGDYQLAGEWASYRLERERQGSAGLDHTEYVRRVVKQLPRQEPHANQWDVCVRSGHQYRLGKNASNYRTVANRILQKILGGYMNEQLMVWMTENVVAIEDVILAENSWDRLPILADALEEAGCDDLSILTYLRSFSGSTLETK